MKSKVFIAVLQLCIIIFELISFVIITEPEQHKKVSFFQKTLLFIIGLSHYLSAEKYVFTLHLGVPAVLLTRILYLKGEEMWNEDGP